MIPFESQTPEQMKWIENYHRHIQGTLIVLANRKISPTLPEFLQSIFKYEGGIVVGDADIVIGRDFVRDDWKASSTPSKEEQAAVDSIMEMLNAIDFSSEETASETVHKFIESNLSEQELALVEDYVVRGFNGDPLRSFFQKM